MKQITFYLDFISPYAYLAFEELPRALEGLSYGVSYKPIMFAALLKHLGTLGPARSAGDIGLHGRRCGQRRQISAP